MRIRLPKILRIQTGRTHPYGASGSAPTDREIAATINPGVEFEGRMTVAAGTVRLNAHFKGDVLSKGNVIVGQEGEVEGKIQARRISVAGKVKGSIDASEGMLIQAQGIVIGEIYSPSLTVEPGGYFDGQCHPTRNDGAASISHDRLDVEKP